MDHEEQRRKLRQEADRRQAASSDDSPPTGGEGKRRSLDDIARGVEEQIQRAMEAGEFDNLPGRGKPLNLRKNPYLDPSLEMAFNLLENAGYTPEWIAREQEIRRDEAELRARLERAWQARAENEAGWQAALRYAAETIPKINRKIDTFNLTVPIVDRQRFRLSLDYELERLARRASPNEAAL